MMYRPPPEPVANPNNEWVDHYADWYENERAPEYHEWGKLEAKIKAQKAEVKRLRALVKGAYDEGVVNGFLRGAIESPWSTSDSKTAMDDIEVHRREWPEHFESDAAEKAT